jgi:hypothetical protein
MGRIVVDLREIADGVADRFSDRAKNQATAMLILKLAVVLFSAAAGAAQFMTVGEGQPWSSANFVGIGSSIIVALAGLFFAVADQDASSELELARKAVIRASDAERNLVEQTQAIDNIDRYIDAQQR